MPARDQRINPYRFSVYIAELCVKRSKNVFHLGSALGIDPHELLEDDEWPVG